MKFIAFSSIVARATRETVGGEGSLKFKGPLANRARRDAAVAAVAPVTRIDVKIDLAVSRITFDRGLFETLDERMRFIERPELRENEMAIDMMKGTAADDLGQVDIDNRGQTMLVKSLRQLFERLRMNLIDETGGRTTKDLIA